MDTRAAWAYPGRNGGSLQCILGPMGSGKSGALIAEKRRWQVAGKRVLGLVYSAVRTAATTLANRDALHEEAAGTPCLLDYATPAAMDLFDVVCVDEGQFFADLRPAVAQWLGAGKRVIVAGIDSSAEGAPCDGCDPALPGPIVLLVAWATVVEKRLAVCQTCGSMDAAFSVRLPSALVPGADLRDKRHYAARCYRCVGRE